MTGFKGFIRKKKVIMLGAIASATLLMLLIPSLALAQDAEPSAEAIAIDTVWVMPVSYTHLTLPTNREV